MTYWLLPALILAAAAPVMAAPAAPAQVTCDQLFVPPDYDLGCDLRRSGADDWELVVQPHVGTFGWLTELSITPVGEQVDAPATWLSQRVGLDLSSLDGALESLAESPDSPIAGTDLAWPLEGLRRFMKSVADLPLEACQEPERVDRHDAWEMECFWSVGSIRRFMAYRLVERDEDRYLVRIDSMNPKRYRHMLAIANSF